MISDKELKANTEVLQWQPVTLDRTQYVIIEQICNRGEINLDTDKDLEPFVIKGNYLSLANFLGKLTETGLVYIENKKLKLLTDQCQCLILPDGRTVAGENKSGRLTNWVMKEIAKSKEKSND